MFLFVFSDWPESTRKSQQNLNAPWLWFWCFPGVFCRTCFHSLGNVCAVCIRPLTSQEDGEEELWVSRQSRTGTRNTSRTRTTDRPKPLLNPTELQKNDRTIKSDPEPNRPPGSDPDPPVPLRDSSDDEQLPLWSEALNSARSDQDSGDYVSAPR